MLPSSRYRCAPPSPCAVPPLLRFLMPASPSVQRSNKRHDIERAKVFQMTRHLKIRLEYAKLKVERGWTGSNLDQVENLFFNYQGARNIARKVKEDKERAAQQIKERARLTSSINAVIAPDLVKEKEKAPALSSTKGPTTMEASMTAMDVDSDADADGEEDDDVQTPVADSAQPAPKIKTPPARLITPPATRSPTKTTLGTPSTPVYRPPQPPPAMSSPRTGSTVFKAAAQAVAGRHPQPHMPGMPSLPGPSLLPSFGSPVRPPVLIPPPQPFKGPLGKAGAPQLLKLPTGQLFCIVPAHGHPHLPPAVLPVPPHEVERHKKTMTEEQWKAIPVLPHPMLPGFTPGAGPSRIVASPAPKSAGVAPGKPGSASSSGKTPNGMPPFLSGSPSPMFGSPKKVPMPPGSPSKPTSPSKPKSTSGPMPKLSLDDNGTSTAVNKPGDYDSFFSNSFGNGRDYSALKHSSDPRIANLAKQIAERHAQENTGNGSALGSLPPSPTKIRSPISTATNNGIGTPSKPSSSATRPIEPTKPTTQ
ncbi:hypothetical protein BKA62DRAFT_702770 [Auriculariales sp. MPI-PUGE-AT-0066]|nr:hypothetical protein BKA62DRAFT_702770 [Auriculariales sp. MPI-PUGE-AT-0066]